MSMIVIRCCKAHTPECYAFPPCSAMSSDTAASSSSSSAKRARICGHLLATTSSTKTGLAKTLKSLNDEGLLTEPIGEGSENAFRKSPTRRPQELGAESTPYGPCLQEVQLTDDLKWKIIHPAALVWLLSKLSFTSSSLLHAAIQRTGELRVVIFIDEFRPGNVLRPDKGRATQNILWIFADLPEWYICRADAWFQFGIFRSCLLDSIPGGVSALVKAVLKVFWKPGGSPNLATTGCILNHGNENILFRARFGGFLGDEKGMKEVFMSKGPGGMRPCLSCKSVVQFLDHAITPTSYLQGIAAPRCRFVPATDASVWRMADRIQELARTGTRKELDEAEKAYGINFAFQCLAVRRLGARPGAPSHGLGP